MAKVMAKNLKIPTFFGLNPLGKIIYHLIVDILGYQIVRFFILFNFTDPFNDIFLIYHILHEAHTIALTYRSDSMFV
jgi:hypothetical protein